METTVMRNFDVFLTLILFTFSSCANLNCLGDSNFKMGSLEQNVGKDYNRKPNVYYERTAKSSIYRLPPAFYYNYGKPLRYFENIPNIPISEFETRIAGGNTISIEDAPYQAVVQYFGQFICGGTIVSEKHVITAAHCTFNRSVDDFSIRAGSSYDFYGGVVIKVQCIFNHAGFNNVDYKYDVSLIKLQDEFIFSPAIQPLNVINTCSPALPAGAAVIASGWGAVLQDVPNDDHKLRTTVLNILPDSFCQWKTAYDPEIMICAGDLNGQRDTCEGDSGGALIFNGTLVGIVSVGPECGTRGWGGVYTNVAGVRGFLEYMALY